MESLGKFARYIVRHIDPDLVNQPKRPIGIPKSSIALSIDSTLTPSPSNTPASFNKA